MFVPGCVLEPDLLFHVLSAVGLLWVLWKHCLRAPAREAGVASKCKSNNCSPAYAFDARFASGAPWCSTFANAEPGAVAEIVRRSVNLVQTIVFARRYLICAGRPLRARRWPVGEDERLCDLRGPSRRLQTYIRRRLDADAKTTGHGLFGYANKA